MALPQSEALTRDEGRAGAWLSLRGVGKTYCTRKNAVKAVSDASFDVTKGEFISLLGPSGCGKSTLLMMIAGLETATTGEIICAGSRILGPRRNVGIIFQDATLLPWKSALDNVLFPVKLLGLGVERYRARAIELLDMVGLKDFHNAKPSQLSGGMRQRVAICRALVHDPDLLLMDEPFSALDALTRDQMNLALDDILTRYRKTVIFVTHSIREAAYLSDRVVVLGARPSRIIAEIPIALPRPRGLELQETPEFTAICRTLRTAIEDAHATEQPGAAAPGGAAAA
ncbi:MAG TPA: ABC transporter ATP-binding protein [Alphaproteobacteria bacterium]|nr:ABC transporter ATP-binding protein [Alphaproteobacteria bacterium]